MNRILLALFTVFTCQAALAQKNASPAATPAKAGNATTTAYNKQTTFVPGDSVLFIDYFDQEKPGNSPIKWKTSFATPIVEIAGSKWFKLLNNGEYAPKIIRSFPEKYTVEFDIVADGKPNEMGYLGNVYFTFGEMMDESFTNTVEHAQLLTEVFVEKEPTNIFISNGNMTTSGFVQTNAFAANRGQKNHIAFEVDKKRLRMWINDEKVADDTLLIYSDKFDTFRIGLAAWNEADKTAKVLLSDFKYSAGPADNFVKLKKNGKFATAGICFVPGTAKLTPGAAGAIAKLAAGIKENGPHRFKIIAHTDAESANAKELTQQRAELIKKLLVQDHKIDAARLEIVGAGAEVPYAKGRSAEAKANNNRIEISKL